MLAGLTSHPRSFNLFLNASHVTFCYDKPIKDWLFVSLNLCPMNTLMQLVIYFAFHPILVAVSTI